MADVRTEGNETVYVYSAALPPGVCEMVTPCVEGYTVYLSDRLDQQGRIEAYEHALRHIKENDFKKTDVQQIELAASGIGKPTPEEAERAKRWAERLEELRKRHKRERAKLVREYNRARKPFKILGVEPYYRIVDDAYGAPKVVLSLEPDPDPLYRC